MGHYVSIRHNGSLAVVPTAWLFLGVLLPSAVLLALIRLQPTVSFGALTNLGIVLSMATASICLFAAFMAHAARAERWRILSFLAGGLATLWLGLDDFLLVREEVLPSFVPQRVANAAYATIVAAYLVACWRMILRGRVALFLVAVLGLAASMGLDGAIHGEAPASIFVVHALKFLGIAFWSAFHVTAAATAAEEFVTGQVTTVAVSPGMPLRRLVFKGY